MRQCQNKSQGQATRQQVLDAETLRLAVQVSETQIDVSPNPLHGFHGEASTQVVGIGPCSGQAETIPVADTSINHQIIHVFVAILTNTHLPSYKLHAYHTG